MRKESKKTKKKVDIAICVIHFAVHMKLTQHYKSTIHYYKIKIKFKKEAIKILTRGNLQISEKFCAADFPAGAEGNAR